MGTIKIAGVHLDKRRRGDIIEYAPEEKVKPAVLMAAAHCSDEFAMWADSIEPTNFRFSQKGDLLKKKYQNNNYHVEGTAVFHRRRRQGDVLLNPKKQRFSLQFCDCLDSNGLPEFKIEQFEIY